MLSQFGDRFAAPEEVKEYSVEVDLESDNPGGAGLPLMSDGKKVYVCNDDTHSLIIGGSGSKKNRLFIFLLIHLLAKNNENLCVYDPKGENLARTGSYLKSLGYRLIVMDFRHCGKRGDFWNPLWLAYKKYISGQKNKANELFTDFINAIAEKHRETTNDVFWPESAAALAAGIILLLAECAEPEEVNVASFARMCCQDNIEALEQLASKIPENCIAGINLRGVRTAPEKTKLSIYISLFGMIAMFINQRDLVTSLSNSTFDIEEIANEKTAIFIITPDEKTTYNFIVALFVKQAYSVLIEQAQESEELKLKTRFNFILDELCNVPKISDFTNMISAARSRNIRFFIAIQGLRQLQAKYGDDEAQTIIGNCSNIAYLHSRELPLLEMLSKMCGERYLSDGTTRPLITPSQLQRLSKDKGEVLIFTGRLFPYVTELPDIDEYEMFKGYPQMEAEPSTPKEAKVMSLEDVLYDINIGIRSIPFTEVKKEETSYVEKRAEEFDKDDDELQKELDRKFRELFGTDI